MADAADLKSATLIGVWVRTPLPAPQQVKHALQDDCKVSPNHIMVSLSNHRQLGQASFDKLRMSSGHAEL